MKKSIAISKPTQSKAWITRNKNTAIESYKNAESTGKKAVIARKFKKEYGIDLKSIEAPKVKKVRVAKVATTKESFKLKVEELFIPYPVKQLIDGLSKRIEFLEQQLMTK